jgi:hypothetical protein
MSLYVGSHKRVSERQGYSTWEVFYSDTPPTEESHGHIFTYVIGPFRTRLAADIMCYVGQGNPHLQHTGDAERMAKRIRSQGYSTWREYAAAGMPLLRSNPEEDFDLHGEMEQGYTIGDVREGYSIGREGRFMGRVPSFITALRVVLDDMDKNRYWPNVFYVNDHGNVDLLAVRRSKRGKITYKTVQSWV